MVQSTDSADLADPLSPQLGPAGSEGGLAASPSPLVDSSPLVEVDAGGLNLREVVAAESMEAPWIHGVRLYVPSHKFAAAAPSTPFTKHKVAILLEYLCAVVHEEVIDHWVTLSSLCGLLSTVYFSGVPSLSQRFLNID